MSKKEFLKQRNFEAVVDLDRTRGSRLSEIQKEFVGEAIWRGYRLADELQPGPMNPRQRALKKTLVDGARASLADLNTFLFLFGGLGPRAPWFAEKDLLKALPPDLVATVASGLCSAAGRKYADPILAKLKWIYAKEGEQIQIVREPPAG